MAAKKNVLENMKKLDTSYLLDPEVLEQEIQAESSGFESEDIELSKLVCFKDHPFRVDEESEQFQQLKESIEDLGVLTPIIVRPVDDKYEIISGHCRTKAAELVGLKTVPAKVVPMDDYQATIIMAHSNIVGRDSILVSEKARAYRMCIDQQKANGMTKSEAAEIIGGDKDSKRSVQRYVRLSYLIDNLLTSIDIKKLTAQAGFELAFLDEDSQYELWKYITTTNQYPSYDQAKNLRAIFESGDNLSYERIIAELTNIKKNDKPVNKVTFKTKDIAEYFAEDTAPEEMTNVILTLLAKYREGAFDDILA